MWNYFGVSGLLIGYVQIKSLDLFICWVYDKIFPLKTQVFSPYKKISDIK